jgi:glycosyltransferase involved in cell wall biosynthesis
VIPKEANHIPDLQNIKICTWEDRGSKKECTNVLWGERDYYRYIKNTGGINVNLTNRGEPYSDSITAIHDLITLDKFKYVFKMSARVRVREYLHSTVDKIWFRHKMHYKKAYSKKIVTVSEVSKQSITERLNIPAEKVEVIGCGWEHLLEINAVDEKKDARIKDGEYYFSIGNIKPHKNFQWILKEAVAYPQNTFVIAGRMPSHIASEIEANLPNVVLLGYVSDEYMKFLMKNAKALLFPSFFEGFGIPPLEKLAMNGQAVISDIPVLREIYGNTVHYIGKDFGTVDLDAVLQEPVDAPDMVLQTYSWNNAARRWFAIIDEARRI